MDYVERLTDLALALIDLGEPLPCDFIAELVQCGIDVEGLYELNAQN